MTVGLHAVNLANRWLNMLSGTAFTAPTSTHVKLHTGDPGAAGTANASTNTTRVAATWAAANTGSKAIDNTPSWASWAAGSQTISHISVWDDSTGGNVLFTAELTTPRAVTNGDTFNLTSLTFALTPLMAT